MLCMPEGSAGFCSMALSAQQINCSSEPPDQDYLTAQSGFLPMHQTVLGVNLKAGLPGRKKLLKKLRRGSLAV